MPARKLSRTKKASMPRAVAGKAVARTSAKAKPIYVCYDCGTEVTMDNRGIGFSELVCCDRIMQKKRA